MPGGVIDILIREDGHVLMTGEVAGVMSGRFHDDLREKLELDPGSYNKKGQW